MKLSEFLSPENLGDSMGKVISLEGFKENQKKATLNPSLNRLKTIRDSLSKINKLMTELKAMSEEKPTRSDDVK